MGLDAVWQQGAYTGYQVWVWLRDETSLHLFLGALIIIVLAWVLFKSEVRSK